MPKPEKVQEVNALKEALGSAHVIILTDYKGLTAKEITHLRKELRGSGVQYRVAKNTLTRIAAEEMGLPDLNPYLAGPTALAMEGTTLTSAAKILTAFQKNHANLEIKALVYEGKVFPKEKVPGLASLPSREVLLSRVMAGMQAPVAGFVNVLAAPVRQFLNVLNTIKDTKQ